MTGPGTLVYVLGFLCVGGLLFTGQARGPGLHGLARWWVPESAQLSGALLRRRHLGQGALEAGSLTAPAALHGWVLKSGPVDALHWHNDTLTDRRRLFNEWHQRWRGTGRGGAAAGGAALPRPPDPPSAIFPACQLFVNHRYRFIYVRHTKTGSMSLVRYLTECDGPNPGPACLEVLDASLPRQELQQLWADYFVFTVVRNPFKRALSSYKFLVTRMHAEPATCTAGVSWQRFCGDPMALGQRCREAPECCTRSAGLFWAHTVEQARCMLAGEADGGGWAVDYVGRTERMDEDVAEILAEIDRRRPPGAPALRGNPTSGDGEDDDGSSSGPRPINLGPSCTPGGERLQPYKRLSGPNTTFLAAVPQEQYCDDWEYFSGNHSSCLDTLHHFYRRDVELFYGGRVRTPGGGWLRAAVS